jgi:hypothetical protein
LITARQECSCLDKEMQNRLNAKVL